MHEHEWLLTVVDNFWLTSLQLELCQVRRARRPKLERRRRRRRSLTP